MEEHKFDLKLPNRNGLVEEELFSTNENIVLIGANGSGKTRMGVWVEQRNEDRYTVHRISAHKSLSIPEKAQLRNLSNAENTFLMGHESGGHKGSYRWSSEPAIKLLDDFESLISLIFAKAAERDHIFTQASRTMPQAIVPDSPKEIIEKQWQELLPHRKITFNVQDGTVMTEVQDGESYHGKEMSDGERVILYFLGECLCAPDNSIVIIDEPEVHIHKSLLTKLWDKIEELNPNKLFVYITHDLDFATSRIASKKLWIKKYGGSNSWEWEELSQGSEIPESLSLEILGSRKNILFCEGEKGSYDEQIYKTVYENFHIIPRGGCGKVIEATKTVNENNTLYRLAAYGIIDRDYKIQEELDALKDSGIYSLDVAEVENLLCVEQILKIVAQHLSLNPAEKVQEVIDFISGELEKELDIQVSAKIEKIIRNKLQEFKKSGHSKEDMRSVFDSMVASIDIETIYDSEKRKFEEAIHNKDLKLLLRVFNAKSMPARISRIFGMGSGEYPKFVFRLLNSDKKEEIVAALKEYLPEI